LKRTANGLKPGLIPRKFGPMNEEFAPLFRLGRSERLQLVEDLWDSIVQEDAALPLPDWKRDELRRRKERFAQHPASGRTWEEVKQRARAA
jgi:putative addiction module component (TIGR02574 family)